MSEAIQTFEELALRLRPDGTGAYVIQVVRSPYGCRDVHLDAKDLGASLAGLDGLALSLSRSRELGESGARQRPNSEMTPEALGGTLFRAIFRDDLLWTFLLSLGRIQGREDLGLRIRLIFDPLDPALKGLPSLRLVFLNACRTAQVSKDPKLDPFSGSASALALAGVPAILAMQLPISDQAALVFSQRLYEMLAQAFPVDAAVAEARLAVHLDDPSSYEWATPVLYMSVPDGRLFAPAPATSEPLQPHPIAGNQAPTVSGYGTVGGSGGITVGGSGNKIGDIHFSGSKGRDHE